MDAFMWRGLEASHWACAGFRGECQKMTPRLVALMASAVAFVASAGIARADPAQIGVTLASNDFASSSYGMGGVTTGRTLEWDSRKGRWGLKLGVEQRTDHLGEWRAVQPGLYYKLTPRLHIGGAVSFGPTELINPRVVDPQPSAPRARLETTFKF